MRRRIPASKRGKVFEHEPIEFIELSSEDTDNGRFYTLPDGTKLHSMTTMLGLTTDHTWLEEWRQRIGEEAAAKETERCGLRGDGVHMACELYVKNAPMLEVLEAPGEYGRLFHQLKRHLDERVGTILAVEIPLYSKKMRVAGRVDLVCMWWSEGRWKLAIVDYKTSNWIKAKDDIESYQAQLCGYATCLYEMTGLRPEILVNLIATENDTKATIISFTIEESLPVLKRHLEDFYELLDKTNKKLGESGDGKDKG